MLLDPYYRTIEGFGVLIEKDWCGFGHKFQDRIGHADSNYQSQERSPIFIQWLEVVYQLTVQFPSAFEFTEKLLVFVADHLYSGMFGNFLGNNDRQRKLELQVVERTRSIWTYVLSNANAYVNSTYVPHDGAIWPTCSVRLINTWARYYHRWDSDMHPRSASGLSWKDDWGTEQTDGIDVRADLGKHRTASLQAPLTPVHEDGRASHDSIPPPPPPSFDGLHLADLMTPPPPPLEEEEYGGYDDSQSP
jgi:hypothetical protein